jgi:hypothetical protein
MAQSWTVQGWSAARGISAPLSGVLLLSKMAVAIARGCALRAWLVWVFADPAVQLLGRVQLLIVANVVQLP